MFIIFDTSKQILSDGKRICEQIQRDLSEFCFVSKFIRTTPDVEYPKIMYLTELDKVILSINTERYSSIIAFIIGKRAPSSSSNGKLCYFLKRRNNSIDVISDEEINKQIHSRLSFLNYVVPAIVLYCWISPNNPTPPPDMIICSDTFLCYASNNSMSLPQGVHPHQLVLSLYEILKQSPDEPMLLTEFFTETRDHYFNNFPADVKNGYNMDTTFYSKNSLRYPMLIKVEGIRSKSTIKSKNSSKYYPGLFFLVYNSNTLTEGRFNDLTKFINDTKQIFGKCSYKIGEDLLLTDGF